MKAKFVKWGILGTSFISQEMAGAIAGSSQGQLSAVASRDGNRAQDFSEKFSISKRYTSYQDLLNDPNLDVIYIGLPNHLHKEWTLKALDAGKHVLCEKPLALNAQDVLDMITAAHTRGLVCMEAIMYRCHPLIQKLRTIIQDNVIGTIQFFQAAYTAKIAHLANPIAGGAIYNLGCYPLSLIQYLSNAKPVSIKAQGSANLDHPHNDTKASVILGFDDHSIATISVSDDLAMSWQFVIWGTEGRLEMITNPWFPLSGKQVFRIYRSSEESPREVQVTSPDSVYTYQINTFNQLILEPGSSVQEKISLQESLDNILLLEQWHKAVQIEWDAACHRQSLI